MNNRPTHNEKGIEILWFNSEFDEWDKPENEYMIIKNGLINIGSNIREQWIEGILFWTTYGVWKDGKPGPGWTQDDSGSTYKTTKRKLPEGGRWVQIKKYYGESW